MNVKILPLYLLPLFILDRLRQRAQKKAELKNKFRHRVKRVYGYLQRPGFSGPPQLRQFAAKLLAAKPIPATFFATCCPNTYFCCKCPIFLQVTCCKCSAARSRATSGRKVAASGFAANCLYLWGPQKLGRWKLICCKCPYTGKTCLTISDVSKPNLVKFGV